MKLYKSFWTILAATLLTACSQENEAFMPTDEPQSFQLTVTDGGFENADAANTRTTYTGYKTKFEDGDAIGVFAVKSNGAIVEDINNRKFVYNEGIWELEGDVIEYKGTEFKKYTFYCYYPYTDKPAFDTTDEADPFSKMVSSWKVSADQSGDNFGKYDLMTSAASAEGERLQGKVSFKMSHRMSLAVINMPALTYSFDGTALPNYEIKGVKPESITIGSEVGNAYYDSATGGYMFLVKPESKTTVKGTYVGAKKMNFSFEANLKGGCAKMFNIKDESKISHNLQVGDYICADGKLVSVESEEVPANAVAVVFYVGNPQPSVTHPDKVSTEADALLRDYPNAQHGLAIALKNATYDGLATKMFHSGKKGYFHDWFNSDEDWAGKFIGANTKDYAADFPGFMGYNNTKLLTMCFEGKGSENTCDWAYQFINAYRNENPTPNSTTDWYLWSPTEQDEFVKSMSAINAQIRKVGGEELTDGENGANGGHYWSSTTRNETFQWTHAMGNGSYALICERDSRAGAFRMMIAF